VRIPDFKTIGTRRCQSYAPAALTSRKYSWHSFLLEAWVNPRAIVRPEGSCQLKITMTPSRIEPENALNVSYTLNPQHVRIDRLISSCWELWGTGRGEGGPTSTIYSTVLHLQIQEQSAEKLTYISTFKLQSRTKQFCYCNGESSKPSTVSITFFFCGAAAQRGSGTPHSWGF